MTTISAQFKVHASFDMKQMMKSKIGVQTLHAKGWRPLFEFTVEDMLKLFSKNKQIKRRKK